MLVKNKDVINLNVNNKIYQNKQKEQTSGTPQNNNNIIKKFESTIKNKELMTKAKEIMTYNDEELNNLSYELALKQDNRNFLEHYISLLKTKHDIIFTFFNNTDYNSKIIKIDLFLFNFSFFFVINALFFSDKTMHKIYEEKGTFNFIYQLSQILYSSIISNILIILIKKLALSEDDILVFKGIKEKKDLKIKMISLNKKLKIKFLLYFIVNSIFLIFFWYYLSMFCAIYVNTQIHLIKDTIISFALSLIYPLGLYFIPILLRIYALSEPKKNRIYLYKVSQFINNIF